MQLPGKRLLEIAKLLHFHNPQSYEKSELVQLILAIYGLTWTRPIPQAPSNPDSLDSREQPLGRCQHCERDVSLSDMAETACHRCEVLIGNKYHPETLMQLSGRDLQYVLERLQVPKSELTGLEKGELVKLVLKTVGICEDWKPPVPPPPSTRPRSIDVEPPSAAVISPSSNVPGLENLTNEMGSPNDNAFTSTAENSRNNSQVSPNVSQFRSTPPLVPESSDADLRRSSWSNITSLEDIPSAEVIQELKAYQLKAILQQSGIDIVGCCEKKDLADQVHKLWFERHGEEDMDWTPITDQRPDSPVSSEESETISSSANAVPVDEESNSKSNSERRRILILPGQIPSLRNITSPEDLEQLSNQLLMAILQKHSVNYIICKERHELVELVTQLWHDVRKRGSSENLSDTELCKICMDSAIDCVLLECGHMVACTECGRQLSECPICRQYVVRVVHTFKS